MLNIVARLIAQSSVSHGSLRSWDGIMDIQTLLYNLRQDVSCSVCSDIFTDPKQLSCLHSFCLECLTRWYGTCGGGNSIKCPKCQSLCRVPASGDLKDLPTSFYLNGLIDVLAIKECHKTGVKCGNCDKKSSEASYCFQCCIFYCEDCEQHHNFMRSNRGHRILAIKEFRDKDYEDFLKRPAFCVKPRHGKEELKFFCKNCKTAVCQTCVTLVHAGHALEHIEDEAERQKAEVVITVKTLQQILQMKQNRLMELDKDHEKLFQDSEDVKRDVQMFLDRLLAIIEAKKRAIFLEVENKTRKSFEHLTTEKCKIENEIKAIDALLEKADKLLTQSTDAEIIQLNKSLQTSFSRFSETETTSSDLEALPTRFFVENKKLLDTVNSEDIGFLEMPHQTKANQSIAEGEGLNEAVAGSEAQFTLTTRNSNARRCYDKRDLVTVEIRDERGLECVTEVRMIDAKNGQYDISYSPREQGRHSVIIKINGEHAQGSPFALLVKAREQDLSCSSRSATGTERVERSSSSSASAHFPSLEQGASSQSDALRQYQVKPVLSFGKQGSSVGMFNCPWGVAVSDADEIAVTDQLNHRVQIFDSNGNFLRSFGRQGNKEGQFNSPVGIAFGKNRSIYVSDSWNNRIQHFSWEGRYLSMFGGQGSLHNRLSNPCGLSTANSHCNDIIVADADNKVVKAFTLYGVFMRKMGGQRSFTFPLHCVQCQGYFVVSDRDEHCIKVFDGQGKLMYRFGKRGAGNGEFKSPGCLAENKSGQLLVCDSGNHRIQTFELDGKFVNSFGNKGRNLGEFNNPQSVAVLSNGGIVVSDYGNNRIQIFEGEISPPTGGVI